MSTVPANSDTLPYLSSGNAGSDGINETDYFVTRNPWVLNTGKMSLLGDRVAVAYPAGLNFDSHRTRAWLWYLLFHNFERSILAGYLNAAHADIPS
jgi:hypothetical protein